MNKLISAFSPFLLPLTPADVVSIVFLTLLTFLNIIFFQRVEQASLLILVNCSVTIGILLLSKKAYDSRSNIWGALHRWYYYPFILFVFKEIYLMVRPIHPIDYDQLFIAIDRWFFGVDPTVWLSQFAHPILTEILQWAYFSYYFLFIILGYELFRKYDMSTFDRAAFFIVYGFYLSYLGYFLLPAVGPRFTLHNFYAINEELPGLWLTPFMREFINAGESISFSMPNAIDYVQRDVFPSGHTQLTLVIVYLSHQYKISSRWGITLIAILLIISTVYLRYHYVIDLIGGAAFFFLTMWTGQRIQNAWQQFKERLITPNTYT
ncbi:MAG: phosphatase PAP2 family protein [Bacteroidetes bacterium]|nr:phosphatase PAP2 family protein [Bacteroidota bacterium]